MSIKRTLSAIALSFAAAAGSGCAMDGNYGFPTLGGAALGGVAGNALTKSTLGTIGGAILGGMLGNMLESDCKTRFNSNLNRNVIGNTVGPWRGSEGLDTNCHYSGNNPASNLNAPGHLQHLKGNGTVPLRQ